jgi:hypothetical protein
VVGQVFPQLADQFGILGKALHQDLAGAVEHRPGVGKARLGVEIGARFGLGDQAGVGQQGVGQGSMPASRAIWALVRRFCLKGR